MNLADLLPDPPARHRSDVALTDIHQDKLDEIDGALMRRGTLNAEEVEWKVLEKNSVSILAELPHLGAFRSLVVARYQSNDGRNPADMLDLLKRMVDPYWDALLPTGPKSQRLRNAWLDESLKLLRETVERQVADIPDTAEGLKAPIKNLYDALGRRGIIWDGADKLLSDLHSPEPKKIGTAAIATTAQSQPVTGDTQLDARGKTALLRDIIALADRISHHESDADVAFAMRRYATWMGQRKAPHANEQGRIEGTDLPLAIVREMEDLAESGGVDALRKLEDRLQHSPFWFGGHRLAAQLAERLGFSDAADTICRETIRQFNRVPELVEICYSNGQPLIDSETKSWLERIDTRLDLASQETKPFVEEGVEAQNPNSDGFDDMMTTIESPARDLRGKAQIKFKLARTLQMRGHNTAAKILFEELRDTLSNPILADWDNEFAKEIDALVERKSAQPS